jgi:hypothetical protein
VRRTGTSIFFVLLILNEHLLCLLIFNAFFVLVFFGGVVGQFGRRPRSDHQQTNPA